eukprot:scaffold39831_cov38-Prasinocladus_malaysianus.AAC.1
MVAAGGLLLCPGHVHLDASGVPPAGRCVQQGLAGRRPESLRERLPRKPGPACLQAHRPSR